MWMRLWMIGRMKWCPTRLGLNIKEPKTRDSSDHLSSRYRRRTRLSRLSFDCASMRNLTSGQSGVGTLFDLGVGPLETEWFGSRQSGTTPERAKFFFRDFFRIMAASSKSHLES